jgi:hypothetical protein
MTHIRYEEVAESIRNPYWFKHGFITDGVSSNIGWYGILAMVYKLFGFSLFTAKTFRLIFHLVSLFALAEVLRRWMGARYAIIPLIAAGLSPVWLYFNTFQASFGIDLQYLPVVLLLLLSFRFKVSIKELLLQLLSGILCMLACMSYPTFLLYLPFLFIILVWRWWIDNPRKFKFLIIPVVTFAIGFLLPLFAGYTYIKNHDLLVYDQNAQAGLFRGGGKLEISGAVLNTSVRQTLSDLTNNGTSYYFDLPFPDLSNNLALIVFIVIVASGFAFGWKEKRMLAMLILVSAFILVSLLVPGMSSNFPGLRRSTGIIAGIYALVAISFYITMKKWETGKVIKSILIVIFLLLPFSHLTRLTKNLEACSAPSPMDDPWFRIDKTPEVSLMNIYQGILKGMPLSCPDSRGKPGPCRYYEIFATIAGYTEWNHLPYCPVKAIDWRTGNEVDLSVNLWENKQFP